MVGRSIALLTSLLLAAAVATGGCGEGDSDDAPVIPQTPAGNGEARTPADGQTPADGGSTRADKDARSAENGGPASEPHVLGPPKRGDSPAKRRAKLFTQCKLTASLAVGDYKRNLRRACNDIVSGKLAGVDEALREACRKTDAKGASQSTSLTDCEKPSKAQP